MPENRYSNDPRVEMVSATYYKVRAPGGPFDVSIWDDPDQWSVSPSLGSELLRGCASRDEAEARSRAHTTGPYPTATEAIRSLIGDPR